MTTSDPASTPAPISTLAPTSTPAPIPTSSVASTPAPAAALDPASLPLPAHAPASAQAPDAAASPAPGVGQGTDPAASRAYAPAAQDSPFRDERTARDEAPQFVLPLVVRIERAEPPARTDALETAARAVLVMLSDERSVGAGEWAEAMRSWQDARIRKVVRRARGAEWRRAETLPGITVPGKSAEVRVFPPVPLDGWPKELARLQVSGTDLDDPEPPVDADPATPVLWLNPEVAMSAGKAMAQAGHGAQLAWWDLSDEDRTAWREAGFPLAVRTADPDRWPGLTASGLPLVRDAGFTEIAPGSCTVVADHPALRG